VDLKTLEPILTAHPFLRDLEPQHVATLVGCASNVTFEAGSFLFRSGGMADRFFIVRHGRVALGAHTPGRGEITVLTVDAGEVLGWSWLFPPYRWHFDARAQTMVRAIALDGICLRRKADEDPRLGYQLMRRFAQVAIGRLEATQIQLMDLYAG